jgi:transcriptional regulator with XRE-family HTH domain
MSRHPDLFPVDAQRLTEARRRRVLSRPELADAAGVDRATLYRLERGGQHAKPATVRKLAESLGVAPGWLTGAEHHAYGGVTATNSTPTVTFTGGTG